MTEIYWLTRIGVIGNVCTVASVCGIVLFFLFLIFYPMILDMIGDDKGVAVFKRYLKYAAVIWVVSILGAVFVPTQKEMQLIYGLGTTVDYIQSNDKAQQLPDKAVEALERYLDGIEKETSEKSE